LRAKTHNETKAFKTALNRRSIVERRFATLVRNHNLRRSRFIGMMATSKHILLANTACNVIRLLKIFQQSNSCSHFAT
ncbi:MAG: transposase, partial [Bacillota bacterium]|nr:transposase [Bacillota bacterium]